MIPLASLLTSPTSTSVRGVMVAGLTALGLPASKWRAGGVASTLLTITASTIAATAALVSQVLNGFFLPTATGAWLVLLAFYVYGVVANPATAATGLVSLTNASGVTYTKQIGQAIFANSYTGQQYTNTAPFTVGPNATITGIAIQALNVGSIGNASAGPGQGSVDTVVSSMLGVSVTNPAPISGLDADSDATVRLKCLASIAARSYKGPNGAYIAAIKAAVNSSGQPVNVNRWNVSTDPTTGFISVYLAAPSGAPTADDVAAVQTQINLIAQPFGITATAYACTTVPLSASPQTITVWAVGAGTINPDLIAAQVLAQLDLWLSIYQIGGIPIPPSTTGYVYASWLDGVVKGANAAIYAVQGFGADRLLHPGEVAVRTANTTIVVRQVTLQ